MEKIMWLLLRFLSPHKVCTRFVLSAVTCLVLWLVNRSDSGTSASVLEMRCPIKLPSTSIFCSKKVEGERLHLCCHLAGFLGLRLLDLVQHFTCIELFSASLHEQIDQLTLSYQQFPETVFSGME